MLIYIFINILLFILFFILLKNKELFSTLQSNICNIDDALIAQGGVDAVTGRTLKREDAVGDHIIPRSEGIENGGVTEPHNLQVISGYNNSIKSNMNDKSFKNQMKSVA